MAEALVGVVRGATHDAHHFVALGEQQLGEIRAVLPGDAGDQRRPAGLPDPAGRVRFGRPALPGGATKRGTHLFREPGPWREWARSVARAPPRDIPPATRPTRRTPAAPPTRTPA